MSKIKKKNPFTIAETWITHIYLFKETLSLLPECNMESVWSSPLDICNKNVNALVISPIAEIKLITKTVLPGDGGARL